METDLRPGDDLEEVVTSDRAREPTVSTVVSVTDVCEHGVVHNHTLVPNVVLTGAVRLESDVGCRHVR